MLTSVTIIFFILNFFFFVIAAHKTYLYAGGTMLRRHDVLLFVQSYHRASIDGEKSLFQSAAVRFTRNSVRAVVE